MKLQILVNHYKENEQIVQNFLASLDKQTYKDYEVIIGSDGADRLPLSLFDNYSFTCTYLYLEHGGVCHTRNVLLEHATADYVMFCDVDDEFSDENGLSTIVQTAIETNADVIGSTYRAERLQDNKIILSENKQDALRVHGKIFRRQYLIDNHITFPDELEINGDMKFIWLALKLTQNVVWIGYNFYTWKWNEQSVTRQSPYHHYKVYDKTIKCYESLIKDLQERGRNDLLEEVISTIISMIYIDSIIANWEIMPKDTVSIASIAMKSFIKNYTKQYMQINQSLRYQAFQVMMEYYKGPKDNKELFYNIVPWLQKTVSPVDIEAIYKMVLSTLENNYPACLERELAILRLKESMILAKNSVRK